MRLLLSCMILTSGMPTASPLPRLHIDAVVTQAKTGSGNTYSSKLPHDAFGRQIKGEERKSPKTIEMYYPDRELMVMKTHEFAVFQDRYKALSKDYDIAGCRIFMNLRNPIDQLASNYVQAHREIDTNGKMQAAVFDAASYPNLREEFQTWFSHGRKAAALWQTSADLFMLWTGRPLETLIETGIPVVHKVKGRVASEFPNSTLHIHRTEDLSDDGVPKQKVENAKTDFLMQLACEFVRQQKNKDGHYAYTFCVAWSDCCKDLK